MPLEKRVDYLTLHTGKKIEIPFDQLIVFSTNLAPKDLVDEAFLRRIQNKIHIQQPERRRRSARSSAASAASIQRRLRPGRARLSADASITSSRSGSYAPCHPRDLLRILVGIARYHNVAPSFTPEMLDRACQIYFAVF